MEAERGREGVKEGGRERERARERESESERERASFASLYVSFVSIVERSLLTLAHSSGNHDIFGNIGPAS